MSRSSRQAESFTASICAGETACTTKEGRSTRISPKYPDDLPLRRLRQSLLQRR